MIVFCRPAESMRPHPELRGEELRLGQPLTITKANLGKYTGKS